jgi:hypothetical protein
MRFLLHESRATYDMSSHKDVLHLLSIARLNIANSRALDDICSLVRIAQISRSFSGGFWPVSLPLFRGTRRAPEELSVSTTISSSTTGNRFCARRADNLRPFTDIQYSIASSDLQRSLIPAIDDRDPSERHMFVMSPAARLVQSLELMEKVNKST